MKIDKNHILNARQAIAQQNKVLEEGTYACRLLAATWFKDHKRMSFFLVETKTGKKLNASVTLGLEFEGQDTTASQVKKLVALSQAVGAKASQDPEVWAKEITKCAGNPVLVTIKPFTTAKVKEGYNLVYARPVG